MNRKNFQIRKNIVLSPSKAGQEGVSEATDIKRLRSEPSSDVISLKRSQLGDKPRTPISSLQGRIAQQRLVNSVSRGVETTNDEQTPKVALSREGYRLNKVKSDIRMSEPKAQSPKIQAKQMLLKGSRDHIPKPLVISPKRDKLEDVQAKETVESIKITQDYIQNEDTRLEKKSPTRLEASADDNSTEIVRNKMQTAGLQMEPVSASSSKKNESAGGINRRSLELFKQKSQGLLPENTGLMIGENAPQGAALVRGKFLKEHISEEERLKQEEQKKKTKQMLDEQVNIKKRNFELEKQKEKEFEKKEEERIKREIEEINKNKEEQPKSATNSRIAVQTLAAEPGSAGPLTKSIIASTNSANIRSFSSSNLQNKLVDDKKVNENIKSSLSKLQEDNVKLLERNNKQGQIIDFLLQAMAMREKENQTTQNIEQEISDILTSNKNKPALEIKTSNTNIPINSSKFFQNVPYVSPTVNRDISDRFGFVKSGSQIIASNSRNPSQNEKSLAPSAQNSNHLPTSFNNSGIEFPSNTKPTFGFKEKIQSPLSQAFSVGMNHSDKSAGGSNFQSMIGKEIMKGDYIVPNKLQLEVDFQPSNYANIHRIYSSPVKPVALMQPFNTYDKSRGDYSSQHGSRQQIQTNLNSNPDYHRQKDMKVQWFQGPDALNYQEGLAKFPQNKPIMENNPRDSLLNQPTPIQTINLPFNSLAERSINNRPRDIAINTNGKNIVTPTSLKQYTTPKADSGILIIEQGQTARFGELQSTRNVALKQESPSLKGKDSISIALNTFSKPEGPRLSNVDSKDRFPKEIFSVAPRRKFIA